MSALWQMAESLLDELTTRIPRLEMALARATGEQRELLHAVLEEMRLCSEICRSPGLRERMMCPGCGNRRSICFSSRRQWLTKRPRVA